MIIWDDSSTILLSSFISIRLSLNEIELKRDKRKELHLQKKKESLKVVSLSLVKMTLDFSLHLDYTSKERLKKMLNDKQVSIAELFKDTEISSTYIENKKGFR